MKTVRAKLIVLVLACVLPAVVGAVLRAMDAEDDLLSTVQRRVNGANKQFGSVLDDYQTNSRLALTLAQHANKFQAALAAHDPAGASKMVERLGEVYPYRMILAADAQGALMAAANAANAPKSLTAEGSSTFPDLLAGKGLHGIIPVNFANGPGYALIAAEPVIADGKQVGELALITPISKAYLDFAQKKINADLALRINEKTIAASSGHPDPDIDGHAAEATLMEKNGKLYALKTFEPEAMQRPGLKVELTASRDVTELSDESRKDLAKSLALLLIVGVVVLTIALRVASRMGHAVKSISDAAEQVKAGKYVTVPEVKTNDELELLATDFNAMVAGLKERDQLRDTFGRYVTRQIADHLMQGKVALGGELVPVTVLFSDIRSFTSISERMEPRALLDFLNEYFSGMVESVMQHHGVVDKFIGDAIMAVFGAPVPHPDDPLHAIKAALEMRARLQKINVAFKSRVLPELRTGIGIHSGQVVAGNMGHEQRMEYTVIGDAVNLASRLESMTKELHADVILSEDLYKQVAASVEVEPLHMIKVKGREQEVMVYKLLGLKGEVPPFVKPPEQKGAA